MAAEYIRVFRKDGLMLKSMPFNFGSNGVNDPVASALARAHKGALGLPLERVQVTGISKLTSE